MKIIPAISLEQRNLMATMRKSGASIDFIARAFCISDEAVKEHLDHHNQGKPLCKVDRFIWSPKDDEALMRFYRQGKDHNSIARHFGVTRVAVSGRISRLREQEYDRMCDQASRREDGGNRRPHHLENYYRARRGFHVPANKQDRYFALLKAGVPIAEAARQLGLSVGDRAS